MPTVLDIAKIANDAYNNQAQLTGALTRTGQSSSSSKWGFFGTQYNAGGTWVIAFAGTNDPFDAMADIGLYSALQTQFEKAARFAVQAISKPGVAPERIITTGHSLGGALAKWVSLTFQRQGTPVAACYSFNGPNLRQGWITKGLYAAIPILGMTTRRKLPRQAGAGGKIVNIRLQNDVVSKIGNPMGTTHTLPSPKWFSNVLGNHSMGTVLEVLEGAAAGIGNQDAVQFAGP